MGDELYFIAFIFGFLLPYAVPRRYYDRLAGAPLRTKAGEDQSDSKTKETRRRARRVPEEE